VRSSWALLVCLLLSGGRWVLATIVLLAVLGAIAISPSSLVKEAGAVRAPRSNYRASFGAVEPSDVWTASIPVWEAVATDRQRAADGDALRGPWPP
jgi:hypothetical protein